MADASVGPTESRGIGPRVYSVDLLRMLG